MTMFSEVTRQVHLINDLILADMTYGGDDYAQEALDFSKHLLATKYWFIRISFANKRRYLLALLNDVKSAWTLSLLLKAMWNCRPKDAVMSVSETTPWSSYDQPPMDHNRTALPVKTLAKVMTNDRKWFHSLEPEYQAMVLSELLTVSGGPVMWEVHRRADLLYTRYREQQLRNLLECIVVESDEKAARHQAQPKSAAKTKAPTAPSKGEPHSEETSVNTSGAQKELDLALKEWNMKIKEIRDSQKLDEVEMTFIDGTKRKIWKVNRPRPEGVETVDFVQLLPAVVGKRILSFLPSGQLPIFARVNKYWAYLVDEYLSEMAVRSKLQLDLETLQESMLQHDRSMVMVAQPMYGTSTVAPSSLAISSVPTKNQSMQPSVRASERSAGAVSFRKFLDEKLRTELKDQLPIRNLSELRTRLDQRGATDEHLWEWCRNVLKHAGRRDGKQEEEGILRFKDMHFPCPLMKRHISVPLGKPLKKDPSYVVTRTRKIKKTISNATLNMPKDKDERRFHLWSRDFSSLYKVLKVASYQSPV